MQYEIDLAPVTSLLRVYEQGKTYDSRDTYATVITVQWLSKEKVYLSGMHGIATRAIHQKVMTKLWLAGATHVSYERDGELVEVDF